MVSALDRSFVHVEGDDDLYTLVHLLTRHGINYGPKPWPIEFPEFKAIGNDEKVLRGMTTAIQAATNRSIGFVIDANSDIQTRWEIVREKLVSVAVDVSESLPEGGFIGESTKFKARVGVWVMPDNRRDGAIETFLESLIKEGDPLIEHARDSTTRAKDFGAQFRESDFTKASVRAWLAWQGEPGHPYGRAIQRKYFTHESEVANQFVSWFRQLFSIPE